MLKNIADIRARIVQLDGNEVIKNFVPLDKLPSVGSKVPGTNYKYGDSREAQMSKNQRIKDSGDQSKYDFYIVNVVDSKDVHVGELYYCIPHKRKGKPNRKMCHALLAEARKYNTVDEYLKNIVNSDLWEKNDVSPEGREEWLANFYQAANITIKELIDSQNMSYADFCSYFGIPRRTVDNWLYLRQPPLYQLIMIEEALGYITLK